MSAAVRIPARARKVSAPNPQNDPRFKRVVEQLKAGSTKLKQHPTPSKKAAEAAASAKGTFDCVKAWLTDFRGDLPRLDVPLLVIQGEEDRILPYAATGKRLPSLIDARFVVIKGGPPLLIT